jgi:glucokinase
MDYCIGIDIGGTNIVIGLIGPDGKIVRGTKIPTRAADGADTILSRIDAAVRETAQAAGVDLAEIGAVGMGVPGFVDHENGISLHSVNLNWRGVPVAPIMREKLGIPTFINNDVRMYIYGEAAQGAGKGYRHVLGLTLGTGLAAALVVDGQLYHGGGNMAGELGHITLDDIPYTCKCGLKGCLETVASGPGLARQARDRIREGRDSVLKEWYPGDAIEQLTAKDLSRAYDMGDPVAVEVLQTTGRLLGKGLASAVTLFSPDVVIVGGGVSAAGERLMAPIREALQAHLIPAYWEHIRVVTAVLGDDAGVIGSGLYAKQRAGLQA